MPLPAGYELFSAKNGSPVAKENGKLLHSQYNPEREAAQTATASKKDGRATCAFFSCGLGYAPVFYAKQFPNDTLIVIEPNADYFFSALTLLDWSPVFSAEHCIIALGASPDEVASLIEANGGFSSCAIIANNNQMEHARDYFSALSHAIERAKQKEKINTNTQERFGKLWVRNSCRNLPYLGSLAGITRYENTCPENLCAVILAAGPSLDEILPHLAKIKKRSVLICTDTALRSCLRAGVEPDFIILVDPQYYAARHIAGLSSPSSVLITESAAYPSVFRFPCKEIVLCSSLFALGKYVERRLGEKGALSAGGSVSTTAWDFARLIGAKKIYFAGLDLGYPDLQTHIRGSTAEEKICAVCDRTRPTETLGIAALFGANMTTATSYDGNSILTDDRMQLFAWWFENKANDFPGIKNFSFSKKSLFIPGFSVASVQNFLQESECSVEREQFFSAAHEEASFAEAQSAKISPSPKNDFSAVYDTLLQEFDALYQHTKKGISLCEQAIADRKNRATYFRSELEKIDSAIRASECKPMLDLIFPLSHRLNEIIAASAISSDSVRADFERSKLIYRELQKAVNIYRNSFIFS